MDREYSGRAAIIAGPAPTGNRRVQPPDPADPAGRPRRRPRPLGRQDRLRPGLAPGRRRSGPGPGRPEGGAPVPAAAAAAALRTAAVRRHAADRRRAGRPLDPGLPGLHPLPGRLPDHPDRAGSGAEGLGRPAGGDTAAGAVRLGGPGARRSAAHRRIRPLLPSRHPGGDGAGTGAAGLRHRPGPGLHEGAAGRRRLQHGPQHRRGRARSAGPPGRADPAAAAACRHRRRPAPAGGDGSVSPKVALQYLLPHRLLSRLAHGVARVRVGWFKDWLIGLVIRRFGVDMDEAANPDPRSYLHFNAFFTRALKPGARQADPDPDTLLMPADGKISQAGRIEEGRIFQAKGQSFTAAELLGSEAMAAPYADGWFANIYLSPRDY